MPPHDRFEVECSTPGVRAYRQRQHITFVSAQGSITIFRLPSSTLVLAKRAVPRRTK